MEKKKIVEYNIIISHNQVMVVDNIDKEEIKKWGKYSTWFDYKNDLKINILDKDFWKSAELMRALLEEPVESWGLKRIIVVIIWLIVFLFSIIVIYYIFNTKENKNISPIVNENIKPKINNKGPLDNKVELESKPAPKTTPMLVAPNVKLKTNIVNDDTIRLNNSLELARLEFSYEKEKLVFKLNECNLKKEVYENKISKLEEKNKICERPIQKIDTDSFLYFLGDNVYKGCKKLEKQWKKNTCKDLYYNFINKNDR